jgi:chorismate synthase
MRFLTAGESHGPCLTAIIDGLPSGLAIDTNVINQELARRQAGYGRGERMAIESDRVNVLGGVIAGKTIGAPLVLQIINRDWENWKTIWESGNLPSVTVPRPGHADWAGMGKHGLADARPILERASARETAARVAIGAVAKLLLRSFGIEIGSTVCSIGSVATTLFLNDDRPDWPAIWDRSEQSPVRCAGDAGTQAMIEAIDQASAEGEALGGTFYLVATGLPVGLGSHGHWDSRLDAQIAQAIVSIPAIKGVEIGPAFNNAQRKGTTVHDALHVTESGNITRPTNRAGGIEGGMSNGQPIVIHAAMKPIPTTIAPQQSVNLQTGQSAQTQYERSDVCAVPAAAVVGEAMLAWTLAAALHDKLGGDSVDEMHAHHEAWRSDD